MLSLPFLKIDILFFFRPWRTREENRGSKWRDTGIASPYDTNDSHFWWGGGKSNKGEKFYQPSRSRGGKKKVKERKRKLVFYPLLDPRTWNYLNTTFPGALKKKVPMNPRKKKTAHYGHDQLKITAISRIGFEPIKLLALSRSWVGLSSSSL